MAPTTVLVCVTRQVSCARLIAAGASLIENQSGELMVVHVAPPGSPLLGAMGEGDALEYLFAIARKHGAMLTVLRASDWLEAVSQHAGRHGVTHVLIGIGPSAADKSVLDSLRAAIPSAEVIEVPA